MTNGFLRKKINRNGKVKHFGNVVHFTRKILRHDIEIILFHGFYQQISFTHLVYQTCPAESPVRGAVLG